MHSEQISPPIIAFLITESIGPEMVTNLMDTPGIKVNCFHIDNRSEPKQYI